MGLGPLAAIYQARFNRYLADRGIKDTSAARVWAFLGDGEMDEPEAIGALSLAAREGLDNLTFVVNCNLQRLDGPVRGNGKIIQELEAVFRGAGWNVIKVIWAREWDDLLARDVDGVLVEQDERDARRRVPEVLASSAAPTSASTSSGRIRGCGSSSSTCPTTTSPSSAAAATTTARSTPPTTRRSSHTGGPTVILAKTVKGWTLGPGVEGRNITHQAKKLTEQELKIFRDRLELPIPDAQAQGRAVLPPRARRARDPVHARAAARRSAGRCRDASCVTKPLRAARTTRLRRVHGRLGRRRRRRRWPSAGCCATCCATRRSASAIVPIIPDEARTFGMDPLFKEVGIYSALGQLYEPVDSNLVLSYREATDGQVLEEGITEAGSSASFQAAGTVVRDPRPSR